MNYTAEEWFDKGIFLAVLGKHKEAIEYLNKSLSINNDPKVRKLKEEIEMELKKK